MKFAPRSLRWRLQAWYGLLLLMVLCAFGLTAFELLKAERQLGGRRPASPALRAGECPACRAPHAT